MDCLRFIELASARSVPPEDLTGYSEHRSGCTECARAEATLRMVRDAAPEPPDAMVGFPARVRARASRENLARTFSPGRSALSAAALALSAAAVVVVTIGTFTSTPSHPPQERGTVALTSANSEDDVDLLSIGDDPLATLTDDELRSMDLIIDEDLDVDEEAGT